MEKKRTVIQPPFRPSLNFPELWQHRELLYFLTWRDIKVKYKQTYLGIAWAVLQPLAFMLLITFLFGFKFRNDAYGVRYEIFVLSGLILWQFFYASVSNAAESIVQQSAIIKKIYFPRLIIPCSTLFAAMADFAIAAILFLLFCVFYRQPLGWQMVLFFPAAVGLNLLAAFGVSTLISALNVKFRDFRYVVPFLLQVLFFATQIIYPLQTFEQSWMKYVLALNPVNGAIELFRYQFLPSLDVTVVLIGLASALFFTFAGLTVFRKTEAYVADLT